MDPGGFCRFAESMHEQIGPHPNPRHHGKAYGKALEVAKLCRVKIKLKGKTRLQFNEDTIA